MAIEEKLNCRTLKTRLTIREALLALLKHKELREITIKECLDSLYTITQTLDGVYMADTGSQWKKNIKLLVKDLKEATPSSKESWKQVAKNIWSAGLLATTEPFLSNKNLIESYQSGSLVISTHNRKWLGLRLLGRWLLFRSGKAL